MTAINVIHVSCPNCSTKDRHYYLEELQQAAAPELCRCGNCHNLYQIDSDGTPINIAPLLLKIRLKDDRIRAATSPDRVVEGMSLIQIAEMLSADVKSSWMTFMGNIITMLGQVEGRVHFLHGELAKRALAQSDLDPLVTTAEQIIDIIATKPDGIPRPT